MLLFYGMESKKLSLVAWKVEFPRQQALEELKTKKRRLEKIWTSIRKFTLLSRIAIGTLTTSPILAPETPNRLASLDPKSFNQSRGFPS